jgi:hypothetical protein
VGHPVDAETIGRGVNALLEPWPLVRRIARQEPWESGELDDDDQAIGRQHVVNAAESSARVREMMQGSRSPREVGPTEVRPLCGIQVGLDDRHPIVDTEIPRSVEQSIKVLRGCIERGHSRVRKVLEKGERTCAGAATQIDDVLRFRTGRQGLDDRSQVFGKYFCLEIENVRVVVCVCLMRPGASVMR